MRCSVCEGKGIVPAEHQDLPTQAWSGEERRLQSRRTDNDALRFSEVIPAAVYRSCPRCQGSGKLHPNLLFA